MTWRVLLHPMTDRVNRVKKLDYILKFVIAPKIHHNIGIPGGKQPTTGAGVETIKPSRNGQEAEDESSGGED